MNVTTDLDNRQRRTMLIIIAYPIVVALIALILNLVVFGVAPYTPTMPSIEGAYVMVVTAILLTVNHSWVMTATELTRVRFRMYATPEEWAASGTSKESVSTQGADELERTHNAHRNTTENTVCFAILCSIFIFSSPTFLALIVWLIGYALARLGYTLSYLTGNDNARGICMTLSLLSMYGMATYLATSIII